MPAPGVGEGEGDMPLKLGPACAGGAYKSGAPGEPFDEADPKDASS